MNSSYEISVNMTTKSDFVARKNEIAILEVKVKFVFLSNSMYVLVFRFNNTQKYSIFTADDDVFILFSINNN